MSALKGASKRSVDEVVRRQTHGSEECELQDQDAARSVVEEADRVARAYTGCVNKESERIMY